jgi:hypothetical protein
MQHNLKNKMFLLGIIATAILITGNFAGSVIRSVDALPPGYPTKGNFVFGNIASIQNDKDGKPAWILTGHWKTNLLNMSENDQNNSSAFSTSFEMTMLDGKNSHTHTLTNFVMTNKSTENNATIVFTGTSSVSLRNGIVQNIPTTIKIMGDKVISIVVDPSKVDNHFGNTPIYGTVMKPDFRPDRFNSNSTWN